MGCGLDLGVVGRRDAADDGARSDLAGGGCGGRELGHRCAHCRGPSWWPVCDTLIGSCRRPRTRYGSSRAPSSRSRRPCKQHRHVPTSTIRSPVLVVRSRVDSTHSSAASTASHDVWGPIPVAPRCSSDAAFALVGAERPKNVFVLGTGRCGTVTVSAACGHFDNYTSGHESLRSELSAARFAYPDHHIESDNRLSWFLGELGRRFDDDETLYVHLTRSPEDVIASYARRWSSGFRSNIGRAFGHGIVIRTDDWPDSEVESVVRFYVETVTTNIEAFLEGRSSMSMQLEAIQRQFPDLIDRIGATGDLQAAMAELQVKHNASGTAAGTAQAEDVVEKDAAPGGLQPEAFPGRLD